MKKNDNNRILMISYYYPPMGTIGFLRNYFFSKSFSAIFNNVYVITTKYPPILNKTAPNTDFVKINRVPNFDYRNLMNFFPNNKKAIRNNINLKSKNKFVEFSRKIIDSFPFNIFFGEGGFIYILFAIIRSIRLIKQNKINYIYSSFRPFSDHFISFILKLIFPKLIWIADFRDLPIDNLRNNVFCPKLHRVIYKRIYSKANFSITVSEGLAKSLQTIVPNIEVFQNGIYNLFESPNISKFNKFTISYTGSLYPNYSNPVPILESIKELIDSDKIDIQYFQLVYCGKDYLLWQEYIEKYNLQNISLIKNEITLQESIEIQSKSHINLILSWASKQQKGVITGKFFEYLNTGNPILCIINGEKDQELEKIYTDLKIGKIFYENDNDKIKDWIWKFFTEWQNDGKIEFEYNQELLENYSWSNKTKELKNILFDN
ncbi:MAG: hypothetical protein R2771_14795 [Saprospiraceae bacterium]